MADQREKFTSRITDKQSRLKAYEYCKTEIGKLDWRTSNSSPYLFHTLIEHTTAKTGDTIEFTFRDGNKAAF